ncbi:uncharacterized protein F4822DRAFT_431052 [Hypoxylon trugodes]|uniref:uncharacterized protein n=1 Tax=Hypoxylon trugodes TaxID=326681 RepID=UPI00219646D7|nr:uncharacterized protein F4822DRAFT_431052 [Hypoxylon trugodes]KAI1386178.1 hypothetical protein F4822DRAFT_431052 [Hypoxylon trugodes]
MEDYTSFTLFSLLPTELRLHIWRHTCHPRVVEVSYDNQEDRCTTLTAPPAVLHVCRESRFEALRIYKPSFGTQSHEPRIYFCHELDTLYLPRPPFMGYDDALRSFTELVPGTDDIVNLAIDYVRPDIRRPWETYNKYALMHSFPKAKEVYLVLDGDTSAEHDTYDIHHPHHIHEDHEDIGLVDPTGDIMALCRLLSDVKESFFYEVGTNYTIDETKEEFFEQPLLPPLVLKSKVISSH